MERLPDLLTDVLEFASLDPCRYVREADLALVYGDREGAVALVARAYLAFDLVLAYCAELMPPDSVRLGKSSSAGPP